MRSCVVLSLLLVDCSVIPGTVREHETRDAQLRTGNFALDCGLLRFARPGMTDFARHFFTSGHREASSDWNASLPGIVASSL